MLILSFWTISGMDERYVVETKICHFICCRLFPFMCACKWIYKLLLLYLRTYLSHNFYKWLLYFQSIFLFITWFLQLHILHQNDFNFSIGSGGFFTFISLFYFSIELFWVILFWQNVFEYLEKKQKNKHTMVTIEF